MFTTGKPDGDDAATSDIVSFSHNVGEIIRKEEEHTLQMQEPQANSTENLEHVRFGIT